MNCETRYEWEIHKLLDHCDALIDYACILLDDDDVVNDVKSDLSMSDREEFRKVITKVRSDIMSSNGFHYR